MRFSQAHLGELVLGGPIGSYSSQGIGSGLVGQNFSHTKTLAHEGSSKEIDKGSIKQLLKAASSACKKARQRNRSSKLSISSRRRGQSEAVARRNSQKEAMFRSASAALSRSLANRGNNRSRGDALILNEAQATLCMGKLLGVEFGQDEASIVNRIVQLEQQDKEKVGVRIGSPGGLGRPEKRGKIKKLVKERKIGMLFLQESKRSVLSEWDIRSIWGCARFEYMQVGSQGSAGGIICVWDPEFFQLQECCGSRNFILLKGTIYHSFNCVLMNVYAPTDVSKRGRLREIIKQLWSNFPSPRCLGGRDFNEIRLISERIGVSRRDRGIREFNAFIDSCELTDIPMIGRKFTWCNSQEGAIWSRIDRSLLDPEWIESFNIKLWGLPKIVFDHCPILLMEDERDWGPKPFRFLNTWIIHPAFSKVVREAWEESQITGWGGFVMLKKLQ
ncbi:hypothetical protein ACSBR2_003281 [Camellia fascicularis]